jgi:protein arginine N-methyltransferase 1
MKYSLTPEFAALVGALLEPTSRQDALTIAAARAGVTPEALEQAFERLRELGFLAEGRPQEQGYASDYCSVYGQKTMLKDFVRTDSFRRAIEETVKPGDHVVDVGSGSGILSLFAARAGARRVTGLEHTSFIDIARELARVNDVDKKITFLPGDARTTTLAEPADVIVSEWIGFFLMEEYMYEVFTSVRDRWLKPGGHVIPGAASLYLGPIEDPHLYIDCGPGYWDVPTYGFDFRACIEPEVREAAMMVVNLSPVSFLSQPAEILHIDCLRDGPEVFHFEVSRELEITRSGQVHGFGSYFDLQLSPSVRLSTAPWLQTTHWKQAYFPCRKFGVERGDIMSLQVSTTKGAAKPQIQIRGQLARKGTTVHSWDLFYPGNSSLELEYFRIF